MAKRTAHAKWEGSLKRGAGRLRVGSGAFDVPYTYKSRFREGDDTNPEELIGAAHSGCFTMALALILGGPGHEPEALETDAKVGLVQAGEGFEIDRIALRTSGRVPGIAADEFERHAEAAKDHCPVSKALAGVGELTLEARLES